MAKFEFKLPDIGEGVTEGEIVNWLVQVGDQVAEDQEMVEVMTDKATVTIGSPKAGTITALGGKVGDVVPVGDVLVEYELDSGAAAPSQAQSDAESGAESGASDGDSDEGPAATAVGDIKESLPGMNLKAPRAPKIQEAESTASDYYNAKPLAAPATRKLARELDVDLRRVEPTGPAGRVTREDVERTASGGTTEPAHTAVTMRPASEPDHAAPAPSPQPPPAPVASRREDQRVPIRGVRKRIYENMARSKHTAAHFTYVDECDVTELRALRERTKKLAERDGVKLTYLPFIVKAVVAALKRHPSLNCLVDDANKELIMRGGYDIGIAAATDAGLMVPVLRNADQLSILDMARELERLGEAVRTGKVPPSDFGGSSFTITSLGKLGGLFATPIVNYPEVAILGVHEMKRKPVVKDDQIVIGHVMLLSLSFDHRIIDGHVGAAFAADIIKYLEEPDRLLLG